MKQVLLSLLLLGCAPQRLPVAISQLPLTPSLAHGEVLYMTFCHQCHPSGAAGLGPSLNDKPLPAFAIWFQVRQGLGAMPAFAPQTISDPDLDTLIEYVQWLHTIARQEGR